MFAVVVPRKWFTLIRLEKGLTQKDVAQLVNVDTTSINKYELGRRNPSPRIAQSLGEKLNFEWTKFYKDEKAKLQERRN